MSNLTKEYFTQQLKGMEERSKVHTEHKVTGMEGRLKAHTEHEVANLARMVSNRFNDIERALNVKEKVEKLERQMREVRQAIGYSK